MQIRIDGCAILYWIQYERVNNAHLTPILIESKADGINHREKIKFQKREREIEGEGVIAVKKSLPNRQ